MNTSRRNFLATAGGAAAFTALSASRVKGANDTIRIGSIGLGGRGGGSADWFSKIKGVEITHLCDADTGTLDRAKKKFPNAKASQDLRKVIEDKDVDAVIVSTCNHWHVLASIWACQAGKDVYVEKPISHNIWEGRKLVEAARKYNRIVQGGTQQRSDDLQDAVKAFLDEGTIGKIKYARLNRFGMRASIGKLDKPLVPPKTVDYNLWLGPAQDVPIYRKSFHYDWHWDWNVGNGELGNWGPHILDDCRNIVFRDRVKLPKRVLSGGGRLLWDDAGETPNTQFYYLDTDEVPVVMAVHNLPRKAGQRADDLYLRRKTNGFLVIECEGGYYAGGRGGGAAYDAEGKKLKGFNGDGGGKHAENFIKAVRSRNRAEQTAEIEEIHYSSAWCHLGNISYRLGAEYNREKAEASVQDFQPWNDLIGDFHAHLEANGIDPAKADLKLGAALDIDAGKETFVGPGATPEALALLRREYREGFVVPDEV